MSLGAGQGIDGVVVRRARTSDVPTIRALVDSYATDRRLLSKATVTLYEDVQEFFVATDGEAVVGCGALHVLWEDLAEVRTLAVAADWLGRGVGSAVLVELLAHARRLGVRRVFCLTFETAFFARHGFARSRVRRSARRSIGSCCSPTTRVWPSSSTWSG